MTINDIAKELNLSIATVSKALNGSSDISAETKATICEYAKKVGYHSRKSVAINGRLVILWGRAHEEGEPLSLIAAAFRRTAEEARYIVEETLLDDGFNLNDFLAGNRFYGALLLDINFRSPVFSQISRTKYPLVLVDNYVAHPLVSGVGSDNIHAVEDAVDHLVALGHRRIAFLGGELQSLVGTERLAGYILGLARNSIEYRYDLTYFGDYSYRAGVDAAQYYLEYDKQFTAIVCASDRMARGFIDRMKEAGKRVPDDFSVIGYDDACGGEFPLTTVRQDFERTGELGYRVLQSLLKGIPSQRAYVPHVLITRGTTAQKRSTP